MDDYISKPVDLDELEVLLLEWAQPPLRSLPGSTSSEQLSDNRTEEHAEESDIDRERLAELSELQAADGSSLVQSFITSFIDRSRDRFGVIQAAVAASDLTTLANAVHELKGAAGTIGAVRVAALCHEVEAAVRVGHPPRAELLEELSEALDHANAALSNLDVQLT